MIKMFLAGNFLIEFLLVRFCPKLNTWLSWKECCATAVKDIKNRRVFILQLLCFLRIFLLLKQVKKCEGREKRAGHSFYAVISFTTEGLFN